MDIDKSWLASKTIWGALLVVIATAVQIFGYDLGDTNELANQLAALAGAIIAIYGRVKAVKRIKV